MIFSIKKFNREIKALNSLKISNRLHPLVEAQIKQRVIGEIQAGAKTSSRNSTWYVFKSRVVQILISILASLGLVGGTAFASVSALPGDTLYPVKRAVEKVQVATTFSAQSKATLQADIAQKRLEELAEVRVNSTKYSEVSPNATVKAEADAQAQVSTALDALVKVQAKLEAKHDIKAAAVVSENIARLEATIQKDTTIQWNDDVKRRTKQGRDEQRKMDREHKRDKDSQSNNQEQKNNKIDNSEGSEGDGSINLGTRLNNLIRAK